MALWTLDLYLAFLHALKKYFATFRTGDNILPAAISHMYPSLVLILVILYMLQIPHQKEDIDTKLHIFITVL